MKCCQPDDQLYVILPYFNFCGFKRRRQLFLEFIDRIRADSRIRIVVSECLGPAPLGKLKGVWEHVKVETGCSLWIKENLINIAIKGLPKNWKYVSWIDADISFLNENWVSDTIDKLQSDDVVQMFHSVINFGPNGEPIKVDKSFGFMYRGSGKPYMKNDKYGFWHTGYAWACNRKAWNQMKNLVDWAILGSADRHMAMAFAGLVTDSCPGNIHQNYKNLLIEFQNRVKGLSLSWVRGTIMHHWHGALEKRKYRERWDILTKNSYDPLTDIGLTENGVIQMSRKGQRLIGPIEDYFMERDEDS
jgi:hypothetical protein